MRRISAAFATATLAALLQTSSPASAGATVDSNTLTPAPPPGYTCNADHQWVICKGTITLDVVTLPSWELPCGTVYETYVDVFSITRWYDNNGNLVKKFVKTHLDGTWSLSPEGTGPTAIIAAKDDWWVHYETPGDESTGVQTEHAEIAVRAPGYGVIAHITGPDPENGRGVFRIPDDPTVAAKTCDALSN